MDASTRNVRLLAAFAAGAAVLLAGCGASSPSAGVALNRAGTSASGHATAPAATPTPGPATCRSTVLSVLLLGRVRPVARTAHYEIKFQNLSDTICTLAGFPRVAFAGKNFSTQIGSPASRIRGSTERVITLPPQGSALAQISVADTGKYPSRCDQKEVSGLVVSPPGMAHSVRLQFTGLTCANRKYHVLAVTSLVQGPAPNGSS